MRLNPDQLLSFVALVQHGSVGAAARARHLTQPAISNQLKRLQEAVGEPLYRRQGRGVVLTATGEAFYRHAREVQQALQQAEGFAEMLQGGTAGRVRVAASQTIAGSLLPAALAVFRRQYPDIEVFIDSGNSRQVFAGMEEHDLGLVESPLPAGPMACCRTEPLGHDEIVAVMRPDHPLAGQTEITLAELAAHPLIWREAGSGTREVLEQALHTAGLQPEVHLCLGGVAAVLEAVRQGLGIGVVSHLTLPVSEELLITRPLQPRLRRPLTLLLPGRATAAARLFADFLVHDLRARLGASEH